MPKKSTKAAGNVFYEARMQASSCNEKFSSREGTSEETGIDRTRIAHIELGTINPHPEEVLMFADAYNAPELHNYFCSRMCSLGKQTINPIEYDELERVTLRLLSAFNQLDLPAVFNDLVEVAAFGSLDENRERIEEIITKLDSATDRIQAVKLFFKKSMMSS